jgi:hypothetical protein
VNQEAKQEEKQGAQGTKPNQDEEGEEPEKQNDNQISIIQSVNKKN